MIFIAPVIGTARISPIAPHIELQTNRPIVTISGLRCRRFPMTFGKSTLSVWNYREEDLTNVQFRNSQFPSDGCSRKATRFFRIGIEHGRIEHWSDLIV